jgi:hypothetical protein
LHGVRDTVVRGTAGTLWYEVPRRNGAREETSTETGMQKWSKVPRLKEVILYLRSERASGRIFEKTIVPEIVKRIAGYSVRLRRIRDWTLWRGRPLRNGKKRSHTE